jgi:hypothetical protein
MKKTHLYELLAVGALTLLSGGCAADQIVAAPDVAASPAPEATVSRVLEGAVSPAPGGIVIPGCNVGRSASPPPLFVIDGRVIDQNALTSGIDSDQIVSIEIVKGRSALDTYGEAGKNGVVAITTKRAAGTR